MGLLLRLLVLWDAESRATLLSSDVYRYVWEGIVVSSGENPYLDPPNSPNLEHLRLTHSKIWKAVHHRDVPAILSAFSPANIQ